MAASSKYVVICACSEVGAEVAIVDDERPRGGRISIRGPRGNDPDVYTFQMVVVNPPFRFQNRPDLNAYMETLIPGATIEAEKSQSKYNVTHTIWNDGHQSWSFRCMECRQQVQLSQDTLLSVMDSLAKVCGSLETRVVIDPGTSAKRTTRHMVPLGVLHRLVLRLNR